MRLRLLSVVMGGDDMGRPLSRCSA
jgi:hypothetical protein